MRTNKVLACWEEEYQGQKVLRDENGNIGFYKSDNDRRPSQARWLQTYKDHSVQSTLESFANLTRGKASIKN